MSASQLNRAADVLREAAEVVKTTWWRFVDWLAVIEVISYAKARAEASGLSADGGWIERPDRLVIVLVGAGLTGVGRHFDIPWLQSLIYPAMWILAAASVVTVFQRVLAVRRSEGAREIIFPPTTPPEAGSDGKAE